MFQHFPFYKIIQSFIPCLLNCVSNTLAARPLSPSPSCFKFLCKLPVHHLLHPFLMHWDLPLSLSTSNESLMMICYLVHYLVLSPCLSSATFITFVHSLLFVSKLWFPHLVIGSVLFSLFLTFPFLSPVPATDSQTCHYTKNCRS